MRVIRRIQVDQTVLDVECTRCSFKASLIIDETRGLQDHTARNQIKFMGNRDRGWLLKEDEEICPACMSRGDPIEHCPKCEGVLRGRYCDHCKATF